MTLLICLALLVPLGVLIPRAVVRWRPSGLGIALGAGLALAPGVGIVAGVAYGVTLVRGSDFVLEFDSGFNAWKLLIFLAPAAGLHFRRQAEKGGGA